MSKHAWRSPQGDDETVEADASLTTPLLESASIADSNSPQWTVSALAPTKRSIAAVPTATTTVDSPRSPATSSTSSTSSLDFSNTAYTTEDHNHAKHAKRSRHTSLDVFRGIIVALMAWDHTTHLFTCEDDAYVGGELWSGDFSAYDSSPKLFVSRVASHVCAPGFFLTMGIGMALFTASRMALPHAWSFSRVAKHFALRGLVLLALSPTAEIPTRFPTHVDTGVFRNSVKESYFQREEFHPGHELETFAKSVVSNFQVLTCMGLIMLSAPWALYTPIAKAERTWPGRGGVGMGVVLFVAFFAASNALVVAAQGGWHAAGHELSQPDGPFPHLFAVADAPWKVAARLLVWPGSGPAEWIFISYPVVPWAGIVALGMGLGLAISTDVKRGVRIMRDMAVAFALAFVVVRMFGGPVGNLRGPPRGENLAADGDWTAQTIEWLTVTKYPPDLAFALVTLSMALGMVWALDWACESPWPLGADEDEERKASSPLARGLETNKRVASRAVHAALLTLGRTPLFFYITHFSVIGLLAALAKLATRNPHANRLGLGGMGAVWLLVLGIMLPLCDAFDRFKSKQSVESMWRML